MSHLFYEKDLVDTHSGSACGESTITVCTPLSPETDTTFKFGVPSDACSGCRVIWNAWKVPLSNTHSEFADAPKKFSRDPRDLRPGCIRRFTGDNSRVRLLARVFSSADGIGPAGGQSITEDDPVWRVVRVSKAGNIQGQLRFTAKVSELIDEGRAERRRDRLRIPKFPAAPKEP